MKLTAEEFFREKVKADLELTGAITLHKIPLNAEIAMRWAKEYSDLVNKEINIELIKAEAIQSYLLEHGANDEDLNDDIFVLKGIKTQEEVDRLKLARRK